MKFLNNLSSIIFVVWQNKTYFVLLHFHQNLQCMKQVFISTEQSPFRLTCPGRLNYLVFGNRRLSSHRIAVSGLMAVCVIALVICLLSNTHL